jgi:hypothetical protein
LRIEKLAHEFQKNTIAAVVAAFAAYIFSNIAFTGSLNVLHPAVFSGSISTSDVWFRESC